MQVELDVGDVLPTIRVADARARPKEFVREDARRSRDAIPGAEHVVLPGIGHARSSRTTSSLEAVEAFLEGTSRPPDVPDSVLATVLFTDIVGSTERARRARRPPLARALERASRGSSGASSRASAATEIDTAGDGFFASFDGPARAIACARAVVDASRELGLEVRAGIHTGECELLGRGRSRDSRSHSGARVAAAAGAGEVLVSGTVKDLVAGSGFEFDDRGEHELKGVPGSWRLLRSGSVSCVTDALDRRRRALARSGGGTARSPRIRGDELAAQVLNALVDASRRRPGRDRGRADGLRDARSASRAGTSAAMAPLVAGWPDTVCGTTVDRQCGSSMQTNFNAAAASGRASSTSSSRAASR